MGSARGCPAAQQVSPRSRVRCDLARPAGQGATTGARDRPHAASSSALTPDVEAASPRHQGSRQ
eukprot:10916916-Prorocentrum_lima.AAC.1